MLLTKDKFKSVLSRGNDINIFISDRGGHKSSVAQDFYIDEAMHGNPFILIRSKKDEAITANWLSEYVRGIAAERGLKFWSEKVNPNIQAIYFPIKTKINIYIATVYGSHFRKNIKAHILVALKKLNIYFGKSACRITRSCRTADI